MKWRHEETMMHQKIVLLCAVYGPFCRSLDITQGSEKPC